MAREGRRGGRSVVQRSRLLRDRTFVSISFSFFDMNLLIMWLFWYECWIFPFEHYNYVNMLILSKLKILIVSNMRQLTCQFFNNWPKKVIYGVISAFTKSLASEQSRDITFAALVPWFHIQTLTLTNTPNHTLTRTRFQTLTQPRNEAFSPV